MNIITFFIIALATYRVSIMIAGESGPLNLLDKFRYKAGVLEDMNGNQYGNNNFASGLICVYCNSVWIGLLFTLTYYITNNYYIFLPFALSGFTVIMSSLFLEVIDYG